MAPKRAFITGANGFLGTHLVAALLRDDWDVMVYDRKPAPQTVAGYTYWHGDLFDKESLTTAMKLARPTVVFHLAALADVRHALEMPDQQVQLNFQATVEVLNAMRASNATRIAFTSSAVVYGDSTGLLSERGSWFPRQTSIYGAMKLASESLIEAYCAGYGMRADIFRLVSMVGEGYRHGNLMDFYTKLRANPSEIHILGTGGELKYYIYVGDVIDALQRCVNQDHHGAEIWNVSHHEPNTIDESVDAVCAALHIQPTRVYDHPRWIGDLPHLILDTAKLRMDRDWAPQTSIAEGMRRTVADFIAHGELECVG